MVRRLERDRGLRQLGHRNAANINRRLIMNSNLKVLVSVAALAALVSSPVLAKSRTQHTQPAPARTATGPAVVSPDGRLIGTDPDAAIRFELQRDWQTYQGANN
jgi:hypothetical protein